MEYLKNVLIKEANGPDMVMIIDNLPKDLIYRQARKLVPVPRYALDYSPFDPKLVEAYTLRDETMPDEPRNRRVTGEMVDELLPGIEHSQSGDGGYVFFVEYNEAKERLAAIDRYLREKMGPTAHIPARVHYSSQPGSFIAPPKPLNLIPRVELPEVVAPVSPPTVEVKASAAVQDGNQGGSHGTINKKTRKPMSEDQKEAARIRLAAAREKKKQKEQAASSN